VSGTLGGSLSERRRIFLSPPHGSPHDAALIAGSLESGWIAPLGPDVDAFQEEFAAAVGARHAVALSSGTAALHMSLLAAGVAAGDDVLVSSLTFAASANPVAYVGARPVFVDSERDSWNIDPALVAQAIEDRARRSRPPKALIVVHLYGQCADIDPIRGVCEEYGVVLIEDAAEALGAEYRGRAPGSAGFAGVFSFNGNKIITTSGGGMLVAPDASTAARVLKLATQAREPAAHYEHREVGYNYRLSNILAALGRGQLRTLDERVAARRAVFARYASELGDLPGLSFQPEVDWGRHSRWLTVALIGPDEFGATRDELLRRLEEREIEARPVWKPMHLQPVFAECDRIGGDVASDLFERGICLPSGSNLTAADQDRVLDAIRSVAKGAGGSRS
jgi:dTDP-4-amino-4,6-dideoxygalactose transaminase